MIKHVPSVSSGKDSLATLLICLENCPREDVLPIFCDTGNEHQAVYDYLDYLETELDIKITRLKADFTEHIYGKRQFIANDQCHKREYDTELVFDTAGNPVPKRDGRGNIIMHKVKRKGVMVDEPVQKTKKVGGGHRIRWSNKAKRRALSILFPSGNPFLDLCLWKGRFPSRKAQFCTEELKRNMAISFQLDLIDAGHQVLSWQGVRRDESLNRRDAKKIERIGKGLWTFRPIVDWSIQDVFEFAAKRGIKPNPLYLQGMGRVGCMPCINANKKELKQIGARFSEHIERISIWEYLVAQASKRRAATFIAAPGITPDQAVNHGIHSIIEWANTRRGGGSQNQIMLFDDPDESISGCTSSYGLCDQTS